jgi:hypothetical protein
VGKRKERPFQRQEVNTKQEKYYKSESHHFPRKSDSEMSLNCPSTTAVAVKFGAERCTIATMAGFFYYSHWYQLKRKKMLPS